MKNIWKHKIVFTAIFAFILVLPSVLGVNIIDQILGNSAFRGINIGEAYFRYAPFIDAILYFMLFIGLAKMALGEKFKDQTIVPVAIGIILAISMCVFEYKSGFNLSVLSGYAALIFFFLLGFLPYKLFKEAGAKAFYAFCLAYLITFSLIMGLGIGNSFVDWVMGKSPFLRAIIWILYVLSIIGALAGIVDLVKEWRNGKKDIKDAEKEQKNTIGAWKKTFDKEKNAEKKFLDIEKEMRSFETSLGQLENIEKTYSQEDLVERQKQLEMLRKLEEAVIGTERLQKGIQNVYSHMGDPAYEQYKPQLQQYVAMLDQYISTLRTIIFKLQESMSKCMTNEKEELKYDQKIKQYIEKIEFDDQKMKQMEGDFSYLEKVDNAEYAKLQQRFGEFDKKLKDSVTAEQTLEKGIDVNFIKNIESLDNDNDARIKRMIELTGKNNVKSLRLNIFSKEVIANFVTPQSLQQILVHIRKMQENVTNIINLKNKFHEAVGQKNDFLKNSYLPLEEQMMKEFSADISTAAQGSLKMFKEEEAAFDRMGKQFADEIDKLLQTKDVARAQQVVAKLRSNIASLDRKKEKNVLTTLGKYANAVRKIISQKDFFAKDAKTGLPTGEITQKYKDELLRIKSDILKTIENIASLDNSSTAKDVAAESKAANDMARTGVRM